MLYLLAFFKGLFSREDGQTLLEYGLIIFLIALICIAALTLFGVSTSNMLTTVANAF